jgi:hypothetical protein
VKKSLLPSFCCESVVVSFLGGSAVLGGAKKVPFKSSGRMIVSADLNEIQVV